MAGSGVKHVNRQADGLVEPELPCPILAVVEVVFSHSMIEAGPQFLRYHCTRPAPECSRTPLR